MSNPHQVLGVSPNATEAEIKSAFRKLAKECHPDQNRDDPDAESRFKEISAAYEQLTKQPQQHQQAQQGFNFNFGVDDLHQHFFDQMARMRREQEIRAQNSDLQTVVEITLEQAFAGCHVDVHLRQLPGSPTHRVSIPKGVAHLNRIRVPGAGLQRNPNYPPGDLYVVVHILVHERLARIGDDLATRIEINSFEAIVGKVMTVQGIDGKPISFDIPAGVQYGDRMRSPGNGMSILQGDARGSLVAEIVIRTPTTIAEEHRNLVNQIANLLPKPGNAE